MEILPHDQQSCIAFKETKVLQNPEDGLKDTLNENSGDPDTPSTVLVSSTKDSNAVPPNI